MNPRDRSHGIGRRSGICENPDQKIAMAPSAAWKGVFRSAGSGQTYEPPIYWAFTLPPPRNPHFDAQTSAPAATGGAALFTPRTPLAGVLLLILVALSISAGPMLRADVLAAGPERLLDAASRLVMPETRHQQTVMTRRERLRPDVDSMHAARRGAAAGGFHAGMDKVHFLAAPMRLAGLVRAGLIALPPPMAA
ncbi:hypothetical protein BH11PLA1_BH11PLA1_19120 [soil metagenome]